MEFKIGFPNCDLVFTRKAVAIPTISETLFKDFPLSAFYWPAVWQLTDAAEHYVLGINLTDLPASFWEESPFQGTKKKKVPITYKRITAFTQSFSAAVKKLASYYCFTPEPAFSEFALHTGTDGNFIVPLWIALLFVRQEEVLPYFSIVLEELGQIPEPHQEFAADTMKMIRGIQTAVKFMFNIKNLNKEKIEKAERIRELEEELSNLQQSYDSREAEFEQELTEITSEMKEKDRENVMLRKQVKRLEPKNSKINNRPLKKKKK